MRPIAAGSLGLIALKRAKEAMFALALGLGAATAASAAKAPVYILNGYSFGGLPLGVDTAELTAKFKDQEGAHITRADVDADQAILAKELQARHIGGQLFSTIAEKHGRVWIIFDLLHPERSAANFLTTPHYLKVQNFEGASRISASSLAAATGLKPGDRLPPAKIDAARQAIVAAYAKALPGKPLSLKGKMQTAPSGAVVLTWIIGEPS